MNRSTPMGQSCAPCAEKAFRLQPMSRIEFDRKKIGLQCYNDAGITSHWRSTPADHRQRDPTRLRRSDRDRVARIPQTRHNHVLRLAPIQLHLELITVLHRLKCQSATDEVHRTWRSPQIQRTGAHPF